MLAEPGHVCQVVLTMSHGIDDVTSPVSFDLRLGRTLDELHLVLEVIFLTFNLLYFLLVGNGFFKLDMTRLLANFKMDTICSVA